MKKPELTDKKYYYYHKKQGKRMLNNQLFLADLKKYKELTESKDGAGKN